MAWTGADVVQAACEGSGTGSSFDGGTVPPFSGVEEPVHVWHVLDMLDVIEFVCVWTAGIRCMDIMFFIAIEIGG